MSKHDKKCEVILWRENVWNACWCHERALEADNERLRGLLRDADFELWERCGPDGSGTIDYHAAEARKQELGMATDQPQPITENPPASS